MPRRFPSANESWIIEEGDVVITKRSKDGPNALSNREALIYWLWWADYMMRNAGNFENAEASEKDFQQEIVARAKLLGLRYTLETFALPRSELQRQYFDRFEAVCEEIKNI